MLGKIGFLHIRPMLQKQSGTVHGSRSNQNEYDVLHTGKTVKSQRSNQQNRPLGAFGQREIQNENYRQKQHEVDRDNIQEATLSAFSSNRESSVLPHAEAKSA